MTYSKKNEHLVPQVILDIGEKIKSSKDQNEIWNLTNRMESIRDYCDSVIKRK